MTEQQQVKTATLYRCVVCGKLGAGRMVPDSYSNRMPHGGASTRRLPRRHMDATGKPCPGNCVLAEWVSVKVEGDDHA